MRYYCNRDRKVVSASKAFKECLIKNFGRNICGHLVISVKPKRSKNG